MSFCRLCYFRDGCNHNLVLLWFIRNYIHVYGFSWFWIADSGKSFTREKRDCWWEGSARGSIVPAHAYQSHLTPVNRNTRASANQKITPRKTSWVTITRWFDTDFSFSILFNRFVIKLMLILLRVSLLF